MRIAGGIGLLGAGAIIQSGGKVGGMTTSAGMWTCAAMGLAAGAGLYRTALMATLLFIAILTIVQWVEPAMKTGDPKPNDPRDADPSQDRQQ